LQPSETLLPQPQGSSPALAFKPCLFFALPPIIHEIQKRLVRFRGTWKERGKESCSVAPLLTVRDSVQIRNRVSGADSARSGAEKQNQHHSCRCSIALRLWREESSSRGRCFEHFCAFPQWIPFPAILGIPRPLHLLLLEVTFTSLEEFGVNICNLLLLLFFKSPKPTFFAEGY
jgi:hypothetical protein